MVGPDNSLRKKLIAYFHESSIGGHSGISAILHRLKQEFYWKRIKHDVYSFVGGRDTCQRCKVEM